MKQTDLHKISYIHFKHIVNNEVTKGPLVDILCDNNSHNMVEGCLFYFFITVLNIHLLTVINADTAMSAGLLPGPSCSEVTVLTTTPPNTNKGLKASFSNNMHIFSSLTN